VREGNILTENVDKIRKLRVKKWLPAKDTDHFFSGMKGGILSVHLYPYVRPALRNKRCRNFYARLELIRGHVIADGFMSQEPGAVTARRLGPTGRRHTNLMAPLILRG
jgi:hypothetical protein